MEISKTITRGWKLQEGGNYRWVETITRGWKLKEGGNKKRVEITGGWKLKEGGSYREYFCTRIHTNPNVFSLRCGECGIRDGNTNIYKNNI